MMPGALSADMLKVLAIGQVLPGECVLIPWFNADPLVDYVLIPTDVDVMGGRRVAGDKVMEDAWRRYIRIYFPKTREVLAGDFEFIAFPDGYIDPFTPGQQADMKFAMESGVSCFITMGGDMAAPSHKAYPGWMSSVLYELLPVTLTDNMKQTGSSFQIEVVKDDPEVLSIFVPLGIHKMVGSGFTYLYPREGTTTWAKMFSTGLPRGAPGAWLVSWRTGSQGGLFWAVADDLDHRWWSPRDNDYGMDIFLNVMLHSTGRKLPEDIILIHEIRNRYWHYNQERQLLYSLLEFVDRFGGNIRSLEDQISGVDELKEESFDRYREQDYEGAWVAINEAQEQIMVTAADAVELKDRALMWVYITEWSAVTGTMFVTGLVVHTLLIKRWLYREVGTTRSK
jgi:hypothetical protein